MDNLEDRIEGLEKRIRSNRIHLLITSCVFMIAIVTLCTLLTLMMFNDTIVLKGLNIVDEKGRTRVILDTTEDGPSLTFLDKKGEYRLMIVGGDDNSGLFIIDSNEKMRASLSLAEDKPAFLLMDDDGKAVFKRP